MLELRDYQNLSVAGLREGFANGHRTQMLYLPTGGGKTEIAISMLDGVSQKGKRAAMLVDRRILCDQTSARLEKYSIDHGVLMSKHWNYSPEKRIQVCSTQTLEKRDSFPAIDLLIIDEAHVMRKSVIQFIDNHPETRVVGLSASPFTDGLGNYYDHIVSRTTTKELVERGMLSKLRVFVAREVDMSGAKKIAGEWSEGEAGKRGMQIVGDVVSEWVKVTHEVYGRPRKSIVFCAGIEHGKALQAKFAESGYNFVSISYKDDDSYTNDVLAEFSKPDSEIMGLIATDKLTKGFDQADVCIGVSARPFSKSFSSHVQQLGRVMRPHESKEASIWIDHSGNFIRFQSDWNDLYSNGVESLDDKESKERKEPTEREKEAAKCPRCNALWPHDSDTCTHCGMVRMRRNQVETVAGEVEEIDGAVTKEKHTSAYKEEFYQGLLGYVRDHKKKDGTPYSEGWAYHTYIKKFGVAPAWKKVAALPNTDVLNFIKFMRIKAAKGRAR